MKFNIIAFSLLFLSLNCFSQKVVETELNQKGAINAGVLMGGGGLIGGDFEAMVAPKIGLQLGVGLGSFGGGINYHFKPNINSSFASIQYWQQGMGASHFASYIGPMFVYRAKKLFQAGLGLGYIVDKGPTFSLKSDTKMILLYNVGVYFPL
jgi:hypothetical protein